MHKTFAIVFLVACADTPSEPKLPGATFTPHLESQASSIACGQETAFYGSATPDLRYGFVFDGDGRITQANGVWLADGSTESSTYTWAGDNLTAVQSTSSFGAQSSIAATYAADDSLLSYTWSYSDPSHQDAWTYVFSNFIAPHQPGREVISQAGGDSFGYNLAYDAHGRLVTATPDTGDVTTWTYDDVARTIMVNTGNGAWVGVMTYDEDYRPLTSVWSGNHPDAVDGDETWAWSGDRLDSVTSRSGTETAPHQLEVVQVDTMLYTCASARRAANKPPQFKRMIGGWFAGS